VDEDTWSLTCEDGTRQRILMLHRIQWPWSSTLKSCAPSTSTSEQWYHHNSRRWIVEASVRVARPSIRFTEWVPGKVPGGMYSPWITTMSSGHDVSEYELDPSGLPPMFHHNNRAKMIRNREKSWFS
jgi:hypothetical protein